MRYVLYNLLMGLAAPVGAAYLLLSHRHRPLLRRFSPSLPGSAGTGVLWVHACSVGEVFVARALLNALQGKNRDNGLLLTVSTLSGLDLARKILPDVPTTFAPFDLAASVRRFIRQLRPAALIILETELWPNLIRETRRAGVPVLILNGRISPRKYPRYRRYRHFLPPVYPLISHVGVQDEVYLHRFAMLGVPKDRITITGNLKFDGVATAVDESRKDAIRLENGFRAGDRIIVFGSTRSGDETLASACWNALKEEYPDLKIVVAPRHLQRVEEVVAAFSGDTLSLRSAIKASGNGGQARILVLDTMGELGGMYAIATVAVIGGSFFPGVEGHNPLESAALGVPTVFGPFMGNFPDAAALLTSVGGAVQASGPEELIPVLKRLLDDVEYSRLLGECGRQAILRNQGASERSLALIDRYLT